MTHKFEIGQVAIIDMETEFRTIRGKVLIRGFDHASNLYDVELLDTASKFTRYFCARRDLSYAPQA
jgi:hypothetical protein